MREKNKHISIVGYSLTCTYLKITEVNRANIIPSKILAVIILKNWEIA